MAEVDLRLKRGVRKYWVIWILLIAFSKLRGLREIESFFSIVDIVLEQPLFDNSIQLKYSSLCGDERGSAC